jgi:hypothetical protein
LFDNLKFCIPQEIYRSIYHWDEAAAAVTLHINQPDLSRLSIYNHYHKRAIEELEGLLLLLYIYIYIYTVDIVKSRILMIIN